jgi:alkylation response protein AidB-like acyl-CoA dehydrogenase
MIIRGRNHYPQDIEITVQKSHPALRPDCGAAFAVDIEGESRLVVAQEVERSYLRKLNVDEVVGAIRSSVSEQHDLQVYAVLLLKTATIPKTSSGKIQRHACQKRFIEGSLELVGSWEANNFATNQEHLPIVQPLSALKQQTLSLSRTTNHTKESNNSKKRADDLINWLHHYANQRINSQLIDERRCIPPYIVLDFGKQGLLGMQIPETYSGLALNHRDTLRVVEQLAAIDLTLATFVGGNNILGIHPIQHFATETLRDELLPSLAKGSEIAALAITEPGAGSNPRAISSQAVANGKNSWKLYGTKVWSGSASWASIINVFVQQLDANNKPIGITGFAVHQGRKGLRLGPEALTMGMRGMVQNTLYLEGIQVSTDALLGQPGAGMNVANETFMLARLGIGAMSLGAMKRCAQLMHRYATYRSISTGRLLDNPLTLIHLSDLSAGITALETLVALVAELLDQGVPVPHEML